MPRSYEDKYEKTISMGAMLANRFNDLKGEIKVQLPCRVKTVDYSNNSVDVEILDYDHDNNGELINFPVLVNVPIRQPMYSGQIYMIMPVQVGDEGVVEFFDSSVDDVLTTGNFDFDYTEKWHNINYGLFTSGFLPKNKIIPLSADTKVIMASKAGAFVFKVNSADELEITTPTLTLKGNLVVSGNITATGEVTGKGKALSTHTHTSAQAGNPTSAPN